MTVPALVWPGKSPAGSPRRAPLVEVPALGHGSGDNRLVHGDNLPVLAALAGELPGQFACVYIDPPYNTGATFDHYSDDDDLPRWLDRLYPCLVLLRRLLRDD